MKLLSGIISATFVAILFTGCVSAAKSYREEIHWEIQKKYNNTPAEILDPESEPDWQLYKHVVIVGIDGAGTYARKIDTPNMDGIFADGLLTKKCKTAKPSISAECWGSMFTGVEPFVHEITNKRVKNFQYTFDAFPTIFKLARDTHPDAKLAAFCNWSAIYKGIIEPGLDVTTGTGSDEEVTQLAIDYFKKEKPEIMFVHFDSVDHEGHFKGFGSKSYKTALKTVDGYLGKIYQAVKDAGMADETLFILTADHGGIFRTHGGNTLEECRVYFGAVGKTVAKNTKLVLNGRDLAPIVCRALNLKTNKNWHAKVPEKMFTDYKKKN